MNAGIKLCDPQKVDKDLMTISFPNRTLFHGVYVNSDTRMLSITSEDETTTPFSSSSVHEVSTQSVTAVRYIMCTSPDARKIIFDAP